MELQQASVWWLLLFRGALQQATRVGLVARPVRVGYVSLPSKARWCMLAK
jgi:hypothetical protein